MADIDDAVGDAPYGLLTNQYSYQQPDYDPNFGFMGIGTDDVGLGKFNWAHKENFDPTKGFFGVPLTQAQQDRRGRWRENRQARRQRRQEGWGRFKDYFSGEVFHDHYRIYDNKNTDIPLVEQMLKFWQFDEDEYKDSQPEIYWTDEEKKFGDNIIKEYVGDGEFGSLLVSDRFGTQRGKHDEETYENEKNKIQGFLASQQIPIFYYTYKSLDELPFKIKSSFDMRNINLRIQLYIKSKAKFNISNQCGTNQLMARYSDSYEIQRQFPIEHNFVKGETYL